MSGNPDLRDPMTRIRWVRDYYLKESDFVDLPNTPLDPDIVVQWLNYRQQLRDFPATCDPNNPVWPEKPPYVKQPIESAVS
jgi:hypothetical protein